MDILKERAKTHGDFSAVAVMAQKVKDAMRAYPGWVACTTRQREALELIATKLARIVCGNPQEEDHWRDIGGYAALGTPAERKDMTLAECVRAAQGNTVLGRDLTPEQMADLERDWARAREQAALGNFVIRNLPPAGTTITFAPREQGDTQPWAGRRGDAEVRGATWDDVREALARG